MTENDGAGARKPICTTCNDTGLVTVCIDEHGMQDAMPCGDCPQSVSSLVVDRWLERGEVGSVPEPQSEQPSTSTTGQCPTCFASALNNPHCNDSFHEVGSVGQGERCVFDSESSWFKSYPDACRRCSGSGMVLVGGHRQDLDDAIRIVCGRCDGTGKEPEICPLCKQSHRYEAQPEAGAVTEYRKKPVVIKANRWFRDGDHPQVTTPPPHCSPTSNIRCEKCGNPSGEHGWIQTLEGGSDRAQLVCPGDWIITGIKGEHYPCKPDIFSKTYESASVAPSVEELEEAAKVAIERLEKAATRVHAGSYHQWQKFELCPESECKTNREAIEALRAALERKQ